MAEILQYEAVTLRQSAEGWDGRVKSRGDGVDEWPEVRKNWDVF